MSALTPGEIVGCFAAAIAATVAVVWAALQVRNIFRFINAATERAQDRLDFALADLVGVLNVWDTPRATPAEAEEAARQVALSRMRGTA